MGWPVELPLHRPQLRIDGSRTGRQHGQIRRDMRNPTGGLLLAVLCIAAPEGGHMSDLEAVPNPAIHSCQILDPGRDVRRIEIVSEDLKRGRQMGYSRAKIVDADQPSRVLAVTQGQGISIGTPPEGLERMEANPLEVVDSPDLPPLWQVFGGHRRADGHWVLPELAVEVASPDAALHIGPQFVIWRDRGHRRCRRHRWHRPHPGRLVSRDVPGPRQGRSVPGRNRTDARRRRHACRPHRHV